MSMDVCFSWCPGADSAPAANCSESAVAVMVGTGVKLAQYGVSVGFVRRNSYLILGVTYRAAAATARDPWQTGLMLCANAHVKSSWAIVYLFRLLMTVSCRAYPGQLRERRRAIGVVVGRCWKMLDVSIHLVFSFSRYGGT